MRSTGVPHCPVNASSVTCSWFLHMLREIHDSTYRLANRLVILAIGFLGQVRMKMNFTSLFEIVRSCFYYVDSQVFVM